MTKIEESAPIIGQQQLAQLTYRLQLQAPQLARRARAGQFVMLRVADGMDPLLRRPFSFSRIVPEDGIVEILYRVAGRGTWRLSQLTAGRSVSLLGPLGNAFQLPAADSSGPVMLLAGGIGIAPLLELIQRLTERSTAAVHLCYGARTAGELLPATAFAEAEIAVHWSTDDGSFGYHGYVPDLFRRVVAEHALQPVQLYACGPLAMQYHVAQWALRHQVPAQLSLESLMACGVGACLGCALPAVAPGDPLADHYLHVCKDGPIFTPGSIQWQKIQLHQAPPQTFLFS